MIWKDEYLTILQYEVVPLLIAGSFIGAILFLMLLWIINIVNGFIAFFGIILFVYLSYKFLKSGLEFALDSWKELGGKNENT